MNPKPANRSQVKRIFIATVVLLGLGAGLGLGVVKWRAQVRDRREAGAIDALRRLVDAGRWTDAEAYSQQQHRILGRMATGVRTDVWRALDFRIAGARRDLPRLVALAEADPSLPIADETAALWLFRTYNAAGMSAPAEALRTAWRGREVSPASWICAEADQLIAMNRIAEARVLLSRRSFPGRDDVGRLLRLALVSADRPADIARCMDEAYRLDPQNPDVRTMRGQLLEKVGQVEYARMEFVAALAADPDNPLQRDQLGSFYLRQRNLPQAAQVLAEKLGPEAPDFLWERAAFVARLIGRPGPDANALPAERRAGYAGWLASLPPGRIWDGTGYSGLNLSSDHELNRPSAFWLGLIERFRQGEDVSAGQRIAQASRLATLEAPTLHASLRLAVAVRGGRSVTASGISFPAAFENEHQFVRQMRAAAAGRSEVGVANEVTRVLRSRNGIAACFLAEGWTAPALALADLEAATTAPEWLQYGLIHALRDGRGMAAALAFAERLPAQPATDYLRAELWLKAGREPAALALLDSLARGSGDVAYRAGWLRATRLVELKRFDEALASLDACRELRPSVPAAELRARIALLRGNTAAAEQQYRSLRERSLEAGAFMARQAYAARDWREARRLTTFWLDKFPDNLQLRRNLVAIAEQEQRP
jgi:predicted Zn-dependent protease